MKTNYDFFTFQELKEMGQMVPASWAGWLETIAMHPDYRNKSMITLNEHTDAPKAMKTLIIYLADLQQNKSCVETFTGRKAAPEEILNPYFKDNNEMSSTAYNRYFLNVDIDYAMGQHKVAKQQFKELKTRNEARLAELDRQIARDEQLHGFH